ncbi:hypothetical protein Tco_0945261 [Tanacetum coccineum]
MSSLPEKPNPRSLTIACSVDIFNINAIADLGANINIMSESILEELSLADPKNANIIVEITDKTREVSLGIKEDMVKIKMKEQECNLTTSVSEHLNERPTSQDELSNGGDSKTHWCEPLGGQTREKTLTVEQEDPEKCGETKTRAIIWAMINELPEEWFSGVSRDMDDLEGIIDYLKPTLYDGFIDHNDEAYKRRRKKLLGMPYTKPPPIIKEEAEITKYNMGAGDIGVNQFTSEKKTYASNGLHVTPISTNVMEETTLGRTKNIGKVCSLEALMRLNSSTWATKWFKRLVAYAKCNRDSYESELGDKELARRRK